MYKTPKCNLWKWDMVLHGQIVYHIHISEVRICTIELFREESNNGKLIIKEY